MIEITANTWSAENLDSSVKTAESTHFTKHRTCSYLEQFLVHEQMVFMNGNNTPIIQVIEKELIDTYHDLYTYCISPLFIFSWSKHGQ